MIKSARYLKLQSVQVKKKHQLKLNVIKYKATTEKKTNKGVALFKIAK